MWSAARNWPWLHLDLPRGTSVMRASEVLVSVCFHCGQCVCVSPSSVLWSVCVSPFCVCCVSVCLHPMYYGQSVCVSILCAAVNVCLYSVYIVSVCVSILCVVWSVCVSPSCVLHQCVSIRCVASVYVCLHPVCCGHCVVSILCVALVWVSILCVVWSVCLPFMCLHPVCCGGLSTFTSWKLGTILALRFLYSLIQLSIKKKASEVDFYIKKPQK